MLSEGMLLAGKLDEFLDPQTLENLMHTSLESHGNEANTHLRSSQMNRPKALEVISDRT